MPPADGDPARDRPALAPGYGVTRERTEAQLSWDWVSEQLTASRSYWVASTRPDGRPHVAPVWGLWLDQAFYFGTDAESVKGRNLAERPDLCVHLESGDEVVILEGRAERVADRAELARILDAYAAKYAIQLESAAPGAPIYRLHPNLALAWLERDFLNTASRFRLPNRTG